jgi:hypothetical protein
MDAPLYGNAALPGDLGQNIVYTPVNLLVGEAYHPITSRFQPGGASLVVFDLRSVAGAINLDHQPVCHAAEIDNEPSNGVLPPESEAVELLAPQPCPQFLLSRSLRLPQLPGPLLNSLSCAPAFGSCHGPPLTPPVRRGENQSPPRETGEGLSVNSHAPL